MSKFCPACGSKHVRRSMRRPLERLLSLIDIYPFRCESCDTRFLTRALDGARRDATR